MADKAGGAGPSVQDVAEVEKRLQALVAAGDGPGLFELLGPHMRALVPLDKASLLLERVVAARGAWLRSARTAGESSPSRGTWKVEAERGEWSVQIALDEEGRIGALQIADTAPTDLRGLRTAEELVKALEGMLGPLPPRLRTAFLTVDRARFVRPCDVELAWENVALPLDTPHGPTMPPFATLIAQHGSLGELLKKGLLGGSGSTISQPLIYAGSFKALGLAEGHRYLDIGSGTGYGAALASSVVGPSGKVTTIDVDPYLVEEATLRNREAGNVSGVVADGLAAADLLRHHDRAWITFAVEKVPEALTDALGEGAVLLAPVGPLDDTQMLTRFARVEGKLTQQALVPVRFIPARALVVPGV